MTQQRGPLGDPLETTPLKRPNFIVFVPDQMRHDLMGCAGHPCVQTPHLDALAANGVRFDRCYTVQPMCMATRATWLTGRTPRGHGVRCNGIPLRRDLPTLPDALRQAGYRTHSIGKIHATPWMPQREYDLNQLDPAQWPECIALWNRGQITALPTPYYGYETADLLVGKTSGHYRNWLLEKEPDGLERIAAGHGDFVSVETTPDVTWKNQLPPELHPTAWAAACAEQFIEQQRSAPNPFFLWCSIPDPHPPYTVADPYFSLYDPADMPSPTRREGELEDLPPHYRQFLAGDLFTDGRIKSTAITAAQLKQVQAVVCGMMTQWDAMVGRVLEKLKASGLLDQTITVVMSDHGQMLGDHWMLNMPPTHLDGTLRVPCIWHCPARFTQGQVSSALLSHLDFAPTVLDLAGVAIPEGDVPPQPEAPDQRPPWPGCSFAPLLTGAATTSRASVIAENDCDYLGLRQRTLVTDRYHVTFYPGQPYGELFDLREDPGQLYNRWQDPACHNLKQELLVQMLEQFALSDSTLPRRLGHA